MNQFNANPTLPISYRVNHVMREMEDTFTLEVEPVEGPTPEFLPGQFNMLYIFGVGEVAISISGRSEKTGALLHTIRNVGTGTRALDKLKKGDILGVRGPYGTAWPMEEAEGHDVVIMAGGIGLAPLRPALRYIDQNRDRFGNIAFLYGARTPDGLLFPKECSHWKSRGIQVKMTVDSAGREWKGNVGVVTTLVERVHFDPHNTVAMICGPEVMMRFAVRELKQAGLANEEIYVSMERNMKCAVGFCGHCQFGPTFVCKDGPVFPYERIRPFLEIREL